MTIYVPVGKVKTDAYDFKSTQFELFGDTTIQIPTGVFQADGDYLPGADQLVTYGASVTVNFALGATARITLTGGCALTLSNLVDGCVYRLVLIQDGTGSRVATWVTTIKWMGATAPTLTTTASRADIITFVQANSIIYGAATLDFG